MSKVDSEILLQVTLEDKQIYWNVINKTEQGRKFTLVTNTNTIMLHTKKTSDTLNT